MAKSPKTVSELEKLGVVPPTDFFPVPERVKEIADIELVLPSPLSSVVDAVMKGGLYARSDIEEAVAGLVNGHLLIAGPPGTGKTQVARQLTSAFQSALTEETANPEWSVFDTIGAQALPGGAKPYRDGVITRSILDCANRTVGHLDTGKAPQANWLLIDEINRAEIDRAFGPLFTALASDGAGAFGLDYRENTPVLAIPRRFRIIATMNSYDTRFVNTMSAGLRRRFARANILPPPNEGSLSSAAELTLAIDRAAQLVTKRLNVKESDLRAALTSHEGEMREVFGALRGVDDNGGTPIGTAQVIDTLVFLATLMILLGSIGDPSKFYDLFDRALSGRMMSSVESDATRLHLREGYAEAFKKRFPGLVRTNTRLSNFLSGAD